jgi:hypothetical protein
MYCSSGLRGTGLGVDRHTAKAAITAAMATPAAYTTNAVKNRLRRNFQKTA